MKTAIANKFKITLIIVTIGLLLILYARYKKQSGIVVIFGDRWLTETDEKLLQRFEEDALSGKANALRACEALYERFYIGYGDFTKAKPYLEAAAKLGDQTAVEILENPEKYYRDLKVRCGEKIPDDYKLK